MGMGNFGDAIPTVETVDEAFALTLRNVLAHGDDLLMGKSKSVGSERRSKELLNYVIKIKSPRDRAISNACRSVSLPLMIARFTWMMAGSDRLADIAFYEDRVRYFSDDGISVPGSNFGQRILRPRPGINQLASAIDLLRGDQRTRRAAISIYQPEDCGRNSVDIPCAFGLFYQVRRDHLTSTTVMRSNNAYGLLPYNLFEFSMLAEVIACEIGIPLGPLTHIAASMHIYESDYERAEEVVNEHPAGRQHPPTLMPEMPANPPPLAQIKELVTLESLLRHESAGVGAENIEHWIARGTENLQEYWAQFYLILLWYVLKKRSQDSSAASAVEKSLTPAWADYLRSST
jgi:thymidylate synthase